MSEPVPVKLILVGAAAGAAAFTVLFAAWLKTNMGAIKQNVAPTGRTIAEEAVKSYLASRVGLTTERLQQISRTITQVRHLTGGGAS